MLVSTVIPTFNRADRLPRAIESALAQTHQAQEILVCDDGSTDDTASVVARYGARVRHLHQDHAGVSAARNLGIAEARGEAIALLDSDDAWLPDKLALQVDVLVRRPDIDLVLNDLIEEDAAGRELRVVRRRAHLPRDGYILADVVRRPALCTSSALMRTRVARALGGFDVGLRTAEDLDFHMRLALRHQIALIERPLSRYTRAPGSLGDGVGSYGDAVFVMERFLDAHADEIPLAVRHVAALEGYARNAQGLAAAGKVRGAVALCARAVGHVRRAADVRVLGRAAASIALHASRKLAVAR